MAVRPAWSGPRFGKGNVMTIMPSAYATRVPKTAAAASRPDWPSAIAKAAASVLVVTALICTSQPAAAQFTQQGTKLIGNGAVNGCCGPQQGYSIALSGDGNTLIVGGPLDDSLPSEEWTGAAWVFTQSGGVWTQQGSPLFGTDVTAEAEQGSSVALSADGNTAIVGAPFDEDHTGSARVYTRSNGIWTQQGPTLAPSDAVGNSNFGTSVALSADGNTAIVGGPGDSSGEGSVWVYTQSGGVWSEQAKLYGSDAVNTPDAAEQGISVALSADGNTAI
jgi:FG-GAP repeat protein